MQAVIQLIDDDGTVLVEQRTDATVPMTYRAPQPFKAPCMVDGQLTPSGEYHIFGFQFQPIVRLMGKRGGF